MGIKTDTLGISHIEEVQLALMPRVREGEREESVGITGRIGAKGVQPEREVSHQGAQGRDGDLSMAVGVGVVATARCVVRCWFAVGSEKVADAAVVSTESKEGGVEGSGVGKGGEDLFHCTREEARDVVGLVGGAVACIGRQHAEGKGLAGRWGAVCDKGSVAASDEGGNEWAGEGIDVLLGRGRAEGMVEGKGGGGDTYSVAVREEGDGDGRGAAVGGAAGGAETGGELDAGHAEGVGGDSWGRVWGWGGGRGRGDAKAPAAEAKGRGHGGVGRRRWWWR